MSTQSGARWRVGLDAHLLSLTQSYRSAGINGYIYQLLNHLPAASRDIEYTAYLHDAGFVPPAGMRLCRSRWDTRSPWRRILWEQTYLAASARQHDLLHGLAYAVPLCQAICPMVVTVLDLSFIRYPDAFRPFNRWYLTAITRASTRRAARVVAISESTRQDVIALCGVPEERVVAIPMGVGQTFCPAAPADVAAFRQHKGLPEHFALFLGTLEPRKNLVRLVEAYAVWRSSADRPVKLIIAGAKGWFYERIFARVDELGLGDEVLFPGFVPGEELPWWYRAADVFVYPSLFEGFGLPVLEAMACGTPTITSRASSLPEVAGEAAVLVDPDDTQELAAALSEVLGDPARAAQMRAAGLIQAAHFSWERMAEATANVYRAVLGGPV